MTATAKAVHTSHRAGPLECQWRVLFSKSRA
jgi:hypothetical protein